MSAYILDLLSVLYTKVLLSLLKLFFHDRAFSRLKFFYAIVFSCFSVFNNIFCFVRLSVNV